MTRLPLLLLLITLTANVSAQEPTSTWSTAKPIVDKWEKEYREAGRTMAARDKTVGAIQQLLREHPTDIWAYEAVALGFNLLNLNDDAVAVIRNYLQRFPADDTLIERVWFFFGNWGNVEDIKSVPERWRTNVRYWKSLFQVYVRTNATPDLLEQVGNEVLARIPPSANSASNERIRIAETWLKRGVNPRAAERVAREAVAIGELGDRPPVIPSSTEQATILKRLLLVNVNRSTLGWALYHQGRFEEALKELQQAAAVSEKESVTSSGLYYRLGQTLEKLNRPGEALEAYFKGVAWEDNEKTVQPAITDLYRRTHGSIKGLDALQQRRVNELLAARVAVAEDLVRTIDEDLGRFEPLDLLGRPFDVRQYRGKVVIVEFWATWCGICRVTMQQTNMLQRKFGGQVAVVAWSSDPEGTQALAARFLKERGYKFALVFGDETARSLQIPFIPARLILDRTGRVRVMEFGYTTASAAKFRQELQAVISNDQRPPIRP